MRLVAVWLALTGLMVPVLCHAAELVAPTFVGPESCSSCHPEAYTAWRQSKHARALESLSDRQKQDPRCLSCHGPDLKEQGTAEVSCETCHGGGQYYAAGYTMKDSELARLLGLLDPSEKSCRSCHDASSPSLKPFEFAEKLRLIDHWTQARQARSGPRSEPAPASKAKKR